MISIYTVYMSRVRVSAYITLTLTRIEPIVIARFHQGLLSRVYLREAAFWEQGWIERLGPSSGEKRRTGTKVLRS